MHFLVAGRLKSARTHNHSTTTSAAEIKGIKKIFLAGYFNFRVAQTALLSGCRRHKMFN
jgi:hypothetical protein